MSNYPPGMSKRDFVRAGIDQPHAHEHEWEVDERSPEIEDAAAIIFEYCMYSEGAHGEGWSCDRQRTHRLEEVSVTKKREGKPDIIYLDTNPKGDFWRVGEAAEVDLLDAGYEVVDFDWSTVDEAGVAVVENENWRVKYETRRKT